MTEPTRATANSSNFPIIMIFKYPVVIMYNKSLKFKAMCSLCGCRIKDGEMIEYDPEHNRVTHRHIKTCNQNKKIL